MSVQVAWYEVQRAIVCPPPPRPRFRARYAVFLLIYFPDSTRDGERPASFHAPIHARHIRRFAALSRINDPGYQEAEAREAKRMMDVTVCGRTSAAAPEQTTCRQRNASSRCAAATANHASAFHRRERKRRRQQTRAVMAPPAQPAGRIYCQPPVRRHHRQRLHCAEKISEYYARVIAVFVFSTLSGECHGFFHVYASVRRQCDNDAKPSLMPVCLRVFRQRHLRVEKNYLSFHQYVQSAAQ